MAEFVVSTWNLDSRRQQQSIDFMQRISALRAAVANAAAVIDGRDYEACGPIKGIFVAPEYFFAAHLAGMPDRRGKTRGRSLFLHAQQQLMHKLAALSAAYPRILIIPGTIAWKQPITETELDNRLNYYFRRESYKPKLAGDALTRALKGTWRRSTNDNQLYNTEQLSNWRSTTGGDLPTTPVTDADLEFYKNNYPEYYKWLAAIAEFDAAQQYSAAAGASKRMLGDTGDRISYMMSNTAYAFLNGQVVFSYHKQGNWHEENGDPGVVFAPGGRSGVAQIEDLTFGLEVCYDHKLGTLRNQMRANKAIDVQILISDFVYRVQNNVVAREGGYFVHASTNAAEAGVWQVSDGRLVQAPLITWQNVGGGNLLHWTMDIKIYDPYSLQDSFMADLKSLKRQWRAAS